MNDQLTAGAASLFATTNALFDLPAHFSNLDISSASEGTIVLSSDAQQASFSAEIITVSDIAQMKMLVGTDLNSDKFVVYPEPYGSDDQKILDYLKDHKNIDDLLTKSVSDNLDVAYAAYLNGDASKVSAYVNLLNALKFPLNIAFYASSDAIALQQPLMVSGPDPVVLNSAGLTFSKQGTIKAETEFTLCCDSMSKTN